jgi:signal peptidase I
MGDHRSASEDSRAQPKNHQFVPEDDVIGRAMLVFWPVDQWGRLQRPDAFTDIPDIEVKR